MPNQLQMSTAWRAPLQLSVLHQNAKCSQLLVKGLYRFRWSEPSRLIPSRCPTSARARATVTSAGSHSEYWHANTANCVLLPLRTLSPRVLVRKLPRSRNSSGVVVAMHGWPSLPPVASSSPPWAFPFENVH